MGSVHEVLANPKRLAQLKLQHIVDSPRDEEFDRLTRLTARALFAPTALMTFVDDHRQWFKSTFGLREPWASRRETPLSHSFCQHVVAQGKVLVVNDAQSHPFLRSNLAIPDLGVIAYLGAPLIDADGSVLGSLSVIDGTPRVWREDEVTTLEDFARLAIHEVRLRAEMIRREQVEVQLRQTQKLEAIGRLAGGIAHDFNNLLLVIQGFAKLLEADIQGTKECIHYIDQISQAATRARGLTRQLLAFGRKQVLHPERVDLNAIAQGLEPMLKQAMGAAFSLELDLARGLRAVMADRTQMEQVILNLVLNARDATNPAGVVKLRTLNRVADAVDESKIKNGVEMQVIDFGKGIDAETLPRIFEPFFTTKRGGESSGLGLATVYGIVQQSQGEIWVDSTPTTGTVFHVVLPAAEPTPSASVLSSLDDRDAPSEATLLVVEDEDAVRKLFATVLERAGYRVLSAAGGQQALTIAEKSAREIDLALVDVVLPGCNGRELADRLRQLRPHMQIVHMSGYNEDQVLRRGIEQGSVRFLEKPISPAQLLAAVAEALSTRIESGAGSLH